MFRVITPFWESNRYGIYVAGSNEGLRLTNLRFADDLLLPSEEPNGLRSASRLQLDKLLTFECGSRKVKGKASAPHDWDFVDARRTFEDQITKAVAATGTASCVSGEPDYDG